MNPPTRHSRFGIFITLVLLGTSTHAAAQSHTFQVGIDRDNDVATGCSLAVAEQGFAGVVTGIDVLASIVVDPATLMVVEANAQTCNGATFDPPSFMDTTGWPVGLNLGLGGGDVVEGYFPRTLVGTFQTLRLVYSATSSSGATDVLLATDGTTNGPAILFSILAIPTLSQWGLIVFVLVLSSLAFVGLRRHSSGAATLLLALVVVGVSLSLAYAAATTSDGDPGDWTGIAPLGNDAVGDSVGGDVNADIVAGFLKVSDTEFCVRMDIANLELQNNPPLVGDQVFVVAELAANGTNVGGVVASDPDPGQTLTFAITAGNTGGAFALDPTTGVLTVANSSALDISVNPSFSLTVQVTDDGVPALSDTATVTVNVTDINQQPTVADQAFAVNEGAPNATVVGTVTASDPDPGQTLTFAITAGNTSGAFALDPTTGVLTVTNSSALDVNVNPSFSLTVQVTDDGVPALSDTATVTVNVTDINEQPTVADQAFAVNEGAPNATVVGTVIASDPDVGQTLTFAITAGNTSGAFALDPTTGVLTVANSSALDVNVNPSFSLSVQVTDDGVPVLSDTATVTVTVTDTNQQPTIADQAFAVDENLPNATVVGTVIASDPDVGQTLTFAITAGNTGNAFAIDPTTGQITVNDTTALDFETNPTFSLTVQVTDDGVPVLANAATVTVNLNDLNEAPGVSALADQTIDEDTSTGALAFTIGDPETPAGSLVLSASSSDPVLLPNANLTFGGAGANPTITATPAADQNGGPVTVTVTVSDGVNMTTTMFTVTVNPVNDPPTLTAIANQTLNEDTSTPALPFTIADIDSPLASLTVTPTSSNTALIPNANLVLGGANPNLTITVTPALNANGGPATVTLTVSDGAAMTPGTFNVTVTPINDPPVGLADSFDFLGNTHLRVDLAPLAGVPFVAVSTVGGVTPLADGVLDNDADPVEGSPVSVLGVRDGTVDCLDVTPPFTDCPTANGGRVSVEANGQFSYTPLPGDPAPTDSFQYRLFDGIDNVVVGVTLNRFDRVWYVNNTNVAPPSPIKGTSVDPFPTLGAAEAASLAGDTIFVHRGDGTSTGQDAGIRLKPDQRLLGEGVDLTVNVALNGNPAPTTVFNASLRPFVEHAAAMSDAVTVLADVVDHNNVEIRGLELAGTRNAILVETTGVNAAGVLIDANVVSAAGAEGVRVNHTSSATATATVSNNTVAAAGNAFDARTSGAGDLELAFDTNTGLTSAAAMGAAVHVEDVAGTGSLFVTGFSGNEVLGTSNGVGVRVLGAVFDANPADADFDPVAGGTLTVGALGDRVPQGVVLGTPASPVLGNLGFGTVNVFSSNGAALRASGAAVSTGGPPPTAGFLLAIAAGTADAVLGPAVALDPLTANVQLTSLSSATSSGAGVSLDTVAGSFVAATGGITGSAGAGFEIIGGTVTATYGGGITQGNNAPAVSVSGGHNTGTVTFQTGTISATAGNGLQFNNADSTYNFTGTVTLNGGDAGIDIVNGSAGTFSFGPNTSITDPSGTAFNADASSANADYAGSITQSNAAMGVRLASNNGMVTLRGGLALNTGSATALSATGGGIVNVCADNNCSLAGGTAVANTIGSTTPLSATAVNINGTVIGPEGVDWRSISVNGAGVSAVPALILANTGPGLFSVSGTGANGSGGTLQDIVGDAVRFLNTDGRVTFEDMIIEDIGNMAGALNNVSGHDAIHGEQVNGGLTLDNVTIRRISDNAIHGEPLAGPGFTNFNGLVIRNSTIEDTNRYHDPAGCAPCGDDNNEAMVRIRGIQGTVEVMGSTLQRGAELLDLSSSDANGDVLNMTVQSSFLRDSFKGLSMALGAKGLACINVKMRGGADANVHIGDPAEASAALGNTFTGCATVAIAIKHDDAAATGEIDTIVSRNILDNSAVELPPLCCGVFGGPFGLGNWPQNSILLRARGTPAATMDAIVSRNTLITTGLAEGNEGSITVFHDGQTVPAVTAGTLQARVSDNVITRPFVAGVFVVAEQNTAARVLVEDNEIVGGMAMHPDFGATPVPGNSSKARTLDNANLDATVRTHGHGTSTTSTSPGFPEQDVVFTEPLSASFKVQGLGNPSTLCASFSNNTSERGYELREDTGSNVSLFRGVSALPMCTAAAPGNCETVMNALGNTGGPTAGAAGTGNPATAPPDVNVSGTSGTITLTSTACALPAGPITGGSF